MCSTPAQRGEVKLSVISLQQGVMC